MQTFLEEAHAIGLARVHIQVLPLTSQSCMTLSKSLISMGPTYKNAKEEISSAKQEPTSKGCGELNEQSMESAQHSFCHPRSVWK